MEKLINKIKQFFINLFSKHNVKKLNAANLITLENEQLKENDVKINNRVEEKTRIFELYSKIKNKTVDLNDIDMKNLLKIRKILLEEAKIQDEKLEDEIKMLDKIAKAS